MPRINQLVGDTASARSRVVHTKGDFLKSGLLLESLSSRIAKAISLDPAANDRLKVIAVTAHGIPSHPLAPHGRSCVLLLEKDLMQVNAASPKPWILQMFSTCPISVTLLWLIEVPWTVTPRGGSHPLNGSAWPVQGQNGLLGSFLRMLSDCVG